MTPEQFCYWLQGFAELSGDNPPTIEQWKSIREHIATVFKKVTPQLGALMTIGNDAPLYNGHDGLQQLNANLNDLHC